CMQGIQFPFAF
nr:immunoglobulin light chain junction region [Macaca mulatta]MPN90655.1 immunoglobulin light chain junction region [Macaca mulatta]MPN90658.1 immunoglobulin light chain junction region [Macaca mulatta]